MNRNELELAAEERLFDAMLDEVVQAKVAAGGGAQRRRSRGLAAALMLLGLAVVVGVVVTSRSGPAVAVAPQQEQEPLPSRVPVRGIAELQALDRGATNVWYLFRKPAEIAALARLAQLRSVTIEPDPDLSREDRTAAVWTLSPLAECGSLEHVTIGYFGKLDVAEFTVLTRLPKLRSLTLLGRDKVVDAEIGSLLGKLSLRSLVLQAVDVQPEGMRALGELPLLERLELRDCTGLEACDLKHLYRLRHLRALALRGVGDTKPHSAPRRTEDGTGILIELPMLGADGKPLQPITVHWMRGLATALPNLRDLDLSGSRINDEVLTALPRRLLSLRLVSTSGFGEAGVIAVAALPELKAVACSDPQPQQSPWGVIPIVTWRPLLLHKKLKRFEYTGFAGLFAEELCGQTEIEELRLDEGSWTWTRYHRNGEREELPMPSFAFLADLPHLRRVELLSPSPALEAAIRKALPEVLARPVRIEVLPR